MWVLLGNIIAWPAAYFFMNSWLKSFVFKTGISLWIFILAGLIALVIALLTIGFKTAQASRLNPVDTLRYE